jgi:predicted nucleic acid-binding protein
MSAEYFIDTNIFIYAFSPSEELKRNRALGLIHEAVASGKGLISGQVFQEFMHIALHKPSASVPPSILGEYAEHVLRPLCQIIATPSLFARALQIHRETQYRFYDSLIVAAALESGVPILYSEDLQHERQIGSLMIINPFL